MKSQSTSAKSPSMKSKEFAAKTGSKPGAVKKAQKADNKQDKKLANKFGVKWIK